MSAMGVAAYVFKTEGEDFAIIPSNPIDNRLLYAKLAARQGTP
jgi:hypothetical protein